MADIQVNPTRMEMKKLQTRYITARRGHKLLKDKRDELMRQFLSLVKENTTLRRKVENSLKSVNTHMTLAHSVMDEKEVDVAFMLPQQNVQIDVESKNIMSVNVPVFKPQYKSLNEGDVYSYGFAFTSGDLDEATKNLSDVFKKMVRLAEIEKSCQMMSAEIEKTRRRVNALEHVLIPQYMDTIKYITMKLDENERSTTTRLMKVKDMMMHQQIEMQKRQEQLINA
ncbi:MAG: V-type ATP synthase subunit D [Clostridia bacterium]|nr:V-type ATP synthase subunit D [Clostridia bacterium]